MGKTIVNYFSKDKKRKASSVIRTQAKCISIDSANQGIECEIVIISSDEEADFDDLKSKRLKVNDQCVTQEKINKTINEFSNDDEEKSPANEKELCENSLESTSSSYSTDLPYYLKNFRLAIDTVIGDSNDATLFEGNDFEWIDKFYGLPTVSQKLYVRLFHRKTAWLPLVKIVYKDICNDLSEPLNTLVQENFLECSATDEKTKLPLHDVLRLLSAPALKTLAKSFHLPVTGIKDQILSSIEAMCKHQRSIFSSSTALKDTVLKRASSALGPCYKIKHEPKQTFNRVLLVFDVTKGTEDDSEFSLAGTSQTPYYNKNRQLSSILLAEMGQVVYPSYSINKTIPVFRNRTELLEYETAYRFLSEIFAATESGHWEVALTLCQSADECSQCITEESKLRATALPQFIRGFSASAVYIRIKSLQVEVLQRLRNYQAASELLRSLMEENHFCLSRRGFWAERLALNLDQHLKDPASALAVIHSALQDEYVRVGHKLALVERALKIQSGGKVENSDAYQLLSRFAFSKAGEVTIVGRLLPKRMQTGQARFMKHVEGSSDDDVLLCSVEELALDHYKCNGYDEGIHGEGGTFTCFLCLLMWDIIFMPDIPDVFRTPYQTNPLDYNTDEFYLNRKQLIDERVKRIKTWESDDFSVYDVMKRHWGQYNGVTCTGMNWERFSSLQQALNLAECIGGKVLGGIVEVLAKDPRHTRSGLPDLVVWNFESRSYKFVEVKGPGDRLSNNQKMWMHILVELGANVEVCHVTANASRKISV